MPDMDIDYTPEAKDTMKALEINMFRWGQLNRIDKIDLINMRREELNLEPFVPEPVRMP